MTQSRSAVWFACLLLLIALSACAPLEIQASGLLPTPTVPIPIHVTLTPPPDPIIQKSIEIPYTDLTGKDAHLLSLDIFSSEPNTGKHPVMIYVHGGGWSAGDKSQVDAKPEFFLKSGFVFISVNYRLCPKVPWTSNVEDIAKAVDWTVKNIAQYGGDPAQIHLIGHSAGGHLVTLLSTDDHYLKAVGLGLSTIRSVTSIDTAAFDLARFASKCENKLPPPYGDAFTQDPAVWKAASPVTYIQPGKNIPPIVIIYSGDMGIGSSVPRQQIAVDFAQKLDVAGIPHVLIGAADKTHNQVNEDFGKPGDPIAEKVLDFLKKLP